MSILIIEGKAGGGEGTSGFSGFSGQSGGGGEGLSGYSGYSGQSGVSGMSGMSGFSSLSGFSGESGSTGPSGFSGMSGKNAVVTGTNGWVQYNNNGVLSGSWGITFDTTNGETTNIQAPSGYFTVGDEYSRPGYKFVNNPETGTFLNDGYEPYSGAYSGVFGLMSNAVLCLDTVNYSEFSGSEDPEDPNNVNCIRTDVKIHSYTINAGESTYSGIGQAKLAFIDDGESYGIGAGEVMSLGYWRYSGQYRTYISFKDSIGEVWPLHFIGGDPNDYEPNNIMVLGRDSVDVYKAFSAHSGISCVDAMLDRTYSVETNTSGICLSQGGTWGSTISQEVIGTSTNMIFKTYSGSSLKEIGRFFSGGMGINTTTPYISDGKGLHVGGKIIRIDESKTPASSGASGCPGEMCWDSNYIYMCVGFSSWKRASISSW